MVAPQRQHGVQPLALPVVQVRELYALRLRHRYQVHRLLVQLFAGGGVGEHQPRVAEHPLAVALQALVDVLGLLAGELQLAGDEVEVVALAHGVHLVLGHLLVDPLQAAADVVLGPARVHGPHMEADRQRHGKVHHVRQAAVGQVALEAAERQHLAPHAVAGEAAGRAAGFELHGVGASQVLCRDSAGDAQVVVAELRALAPRPRHRPYQLQALLAPQHAGAAAHARKHAVRHGAQARQLGHGLLHRVGGDGERQVALAHDVGHALGHLVVEDAAVLGGVGSGGALHAAEEPTVRHLALGKRAVEQQELQPHVRRQAVVELAHLAAHRLLRLVSHALVADVAEADRLAEQPRLHLRDAVGVKGVEADEPVDVLGCAAGPLGRGLAGGALALLVLEPLLDRNVPAALPPGPRRRPLAFPGASCCRLGLLVGGLRRCLGIFDGPLGGGDVLPTGFSRAHSAPLPSASPWPACSDR